MGTFDASRTNSDLQPEHRTQECLLRQGILPGAEMKVTITDKWLPDLSPDERACTVAVPTLHSRLEAVQHYLPLAAEKADEEVEHVHQLRVWTRRATAALHLYKEMMPRRRFGWLKKQLQRIRRAANDARDCDVLIQRLKEKRSGRGTRRWLEAALAERAEAQQAVAAVHDRLQCEDRFARRISKLLERVASRGEEQGRQAPRFGDWARERLGDEVERFFAAVPADPTDAAALHRFRIRGKQLRYGHRTARRGIPRSAPHRTVPGHRGDAGPPRRDQRPGNGTGPASGKDRSGQAAGRGQ
jgi:hypothetical protein